MQSQIAEAKATAKMRSDESPDIQCPGIVLGVLGVQMGFSKTWQSPFVGMHRGHGWIFDGSTFPPNFLLIVVFFAAVDEHVSIGGPDLLSLLRSLATILGNLGFPQGGGVTCTSIR